MSVPDWDTSGIRKSSFENNGVKVRAPARLHLGFLDLGSHLGRRFGSIGVTLESIATEVEVLPAPSFSVTGAGAARVAYVARLLCNQLNLPDRVHIRMTSQIPPHAGLGSGTQLALGVGSALARFWGSRVDLRRIAWRADRGTRSGIGIAAFEGGGFILDGGSAEDTLTPPLLTRLTVPENWRWLLIFDERFQGLSGQREVQAFRELPPFSRRTAADLCYQIVLQGLPALAENRYDDFCETLAAVQRANGDYFSPAQGGRHASRDVSAVLEWLERQGWRGVGQSSWGPTGFCLLPGPETAEQVKAALEKHFAGWKGLRFQVVRSRNRGAEILRPDSKRSSGDIATTVEALSG
ncbi:MAG: beta-ribofuranosylaminobenzene 5'-phosphate synthase family protein [Methylohalobius sp. ZOD2]